jgi:myo-inositol-1(or 4)-monophosphatase
MGRNRLTIGGNVDDFDLDELRSWVRGAGILARRHFNQVVGRRKADRSWVTEADLAIERALVAQIARRYPEHGIIGEEQTRRETDREFVWALDPLDGTASFVAGLPTWGISLGLLRRGTPYLGIVYLPLLDDCYWAGPSGGAFLNGRPVYAAEPREWDGEDWMAIPSNSHRRFSIDFAGKTRSLGCTVASFCYVARGSAVGGLITLAAIWDIAASMAILGAAGGVAIGLSGAALDTTTLLDGQLLPEPVVIGAPTHAERLRAATRERRADESR